MRYALTALALTIAYIALALADLPIAVGASVFYLAAVAVLVLAARRTNGT